jgi:precorrin-2 dehydrogenase/sirohydrochlorin ferrochelatase
MVDDTSPSYPVNLRLRDKPILVVGAGRVARRKVAGLLPTGARITVIGPRVHEELSADAARGRFTLHVRPYASPEARDHWLIFVATGRRDVAQQVVADAHAAGRLVNVADVPELCDFHLPALVRRGPLTWTVASDGLAPFASRRLRQRLQARWGPEYEAWARTAAAFRREVLAAVAAGAEREALFDRFCAETLPREPELDPPRLLTPQERAAWIGGRKGPGDRPADRKERT